MDHTREKKRAAATSVGAALFLTGTKGAVGLLTGSLGILSEAVHSGLDLLAALMTWVAVNTSDRPADADHPYGHDKIDNISALFETLLLLATCVWIIHEAVQRLFFKTVDIEVNVWSFAVIIVAIAVDFGRSRALSRVAKKTHSAALEADALHFSSDIGSSLVVLTGLAFTHFGYPVADALGAIGVSGFIIWISIRLGKRAVDALLDRVPVDHPQLARDAALSVPGVLDVWNVRVRHAGAKHFVDLKVAIDPATPLAVAHEITERVEGAVKNVLLGADIVVHAEPGPTDASG